MMTVIDIRGTHGSGKSYIMSKLLEKWEWKPIVDVAQATKSGPYRERHIGYECQSIKSAIIGSYVTKSGFGGGCDLLFPEEVVRRIQLFAEKYSVVLLEGILVAHTFWRYHKLAQEVEDYRFCFLDTRLSKCIGRVVSRRKTSNPTRLKPFSSENIRSDYYQIGRVRKKCLEAGDRVVDLCTKDPVFHVIDLISCKRKISNALD